MGNGMRCVTSSVRDGSVEFRRWMGARRGAKGEDDGS